ncbi:MAG: hypothetical protein ABI203_11260 [Mucilaginibacter sp.]
MTQKKTNPKSSKEQEKSYEELKDFYEKHLSKLQFWTNIIIITITFVTLLVTSYFSKQNLQLSTNQYKGSVEQFNYLRNADNIKALNDLKKEKENLQRMYRDSVHLSENEKSQNSRNKHQDILNSQQLEINKQQLAAIKIQATTAQNQFAQQAEQYKQQLFEKRSIFEIDSVKIDSSRTIIPKISFMFSNKGIRAPHVDSTVLAFYNPNPKSLCFSVTPNSTDLDLVAGQNQIFTSWVNIYRNCLKDKSTAYYLVIYYKDIVTGQNQIESIFFRYEYNKQHQFSYSRIYGQIKKEFIERLKKKKIFVIE